MTYYYWDFDTDNVFLEEDENGNVIAEYTHEPELYGELIAQERDGQVRYYNFDGQGSTRELTDENGDVTDTYIYSAFGEQVEKTGTTENPFSYKGALGYYTNSDTGDIYVRARTYAPIIVRWLSRDPLRNGTSRLYIYADNSPIQTSDPSGASPNGRGFGVLQTGNSPPGTFDLSSGPCNQTNMERFGNRCCCWEFQVKYWPTTADQARFDSICLHAFTSQTQDRGPWCPVTVSSDWHRDYPKDAQDCWGPGRPSTWTPKWEDFPGGAGPVEGRYNNTSCPWYCALRSLTQSFEVCAVGFRKKQQHLGGGRSARQVIGCISYYYSCKITYTPVPEWTRCCDVTCKLAGSKSETGINPSPPIHGKL